jgi:hypothetical protein
MSSYGIHVPSPDDIHYHEAQQVQRVERAKRLVDVGDVIALVESRLAAQPDPTQHPLYEVINWLLDRQGSVRGDVFWAHWQQLCAAAVDTAIDDALEALEG